MTLKEIASAIVMTSPLWGIAVNAFVSCWVAKNTAHGKSLKSVAVFIVMYIALLFFIAIYATV